MFRYKLRTLMIVLALGPPVLAWLGWPVLERVLLPPRRVDTEQLIFSIGGWELPYPLDNVPLRGLDD
jgi:hypothetical protein